MVASVFVMAAKPRYARSWKVTVPVGIEPEASKLVTTAVNVAVCPATKSRRSGADEKIPTPILVELPSANNVPPLSV